MRKSTRWLAFLLLAAPAACGSPDQRGAGEPTAALEARREAASMIAVVQPRQLIVTAVDARRQPMGAERTVTVRPIVAGERLVLEPVVDH